MASLDIFTEAPEEEDEQLAAVPAVEGLQSGGGPGNHPYEGITQLYKDLLF